MFLLMNTTTLAALRALPFAVLHAVCEEMGIILGSHETMDSLIEQLEALESLCFDVEKFTKILNETIDAVSDAHHSA